MKTPLLFLAALALVATPLCAEDAPKATPAATPAAPQAAAKNVTVDEAQKLLQADPKIIVIDVRSAEEFKSGHIAGAKNIDIFSPDFAKQIAALDKDGTYLIHCASGGRSARACKVPDVLQLKTVYHMNQGFKAWEQAGKPVEKAEPAK
jgi:rhodanese-related sulfurtransferase